MDIARGDGLDLRVEAPLLKEKKDLEKEILILSNGEPWRPLIHVKDMALSIEWALKY